MLVLNLRRIQSTIAAVVVVVVVAQTTGQTVGQAVHEPVKAETIAARCLARVALTDLRIVGSPKQRDYRVTAELLEVARGFAPNDPVLLRLLIEAHENGGNQSRVDELSRELVRLDPADTVAQLRLISSSLRKLQNVQQRLASYDRWLSQEGEQVDPSVRSRLALDAALLARETGDAEGFTRRLTRAMELDSTNKDAATLALTFFSQRVDEAVGRFELMLAVLYSDPIDADIHAAITRHLAAQGAFKGAARFIETTRTLRRNLAIEETADDDLLHDIIRWHTDGPRSIVVRLNENLSDVRSQFLRQRQDLEREKQPTDSVPAPETVRLNMSTEWLRMLAALAIDDEDLIRPSFEEMLETAHQQSEKLSSVDRRPPEVTEEQAANELRGLREETIVLRLWAGRQLDQAAQSLDVLRADPAADPTKLRRIEALTKLRAGEIDAAEQALTDLGADDDMAQLALCLASEARGNKADAAKKYDAFARLNYGSLMGAYAHTRAERLAGAPPAVTPTTLKLEQLAAGLPRWLESVIDSPRRYETLDVKVEPTEARMLDPVRMKITVRNISLIPIGVGPDRPINSRILIAPNVQVATDPVATSTMLQVDSLERRLRLMPREEFTTEIWPDVGSLSVLLDHIYNKPVRVRYRVLQGFELMEGLTYDAGPYGLSSECGPVIRPASAKANADVATITRWVEGGTPRELLEAIILTRGRDLGTVNLPPLSPDEQRAIFDAAGKRFESLEPAWQIALLSTAPPPVQSAKVQPTDEPAVLPLDLAARASLSPAVRTVLLGLRVAKPDDAILVDGANSHDPRLQALAAIVRERLAEGAPCYASFDPDSGNPSPGPSAERLAQPPEEK